MPWTLDQEAPLSSASVTALTDKNRPFRLECYQINVFALVEKSTGACTFPILHKRGRHRLPRRDARVNTGVM